MSSLFSTFMIDITGGAVLDVDALLAAAVPSGASLVSSINAQLGGTTWQGGGSGTPAWGAIVGTLSSQTDLQTALNGKAASSHTHTLSQISDITVTSDMVSIPKGIRPGLYDDHGTPPVGTIFESVNDGHLYWVHRDGSVHLLCDSGGYGGSTWGSISGTLSDQTDLQTALNARQIHSPYLDSAVSLWDAAPDTFVFSTGVSGVLGGITVPAYFRAIMNSANVATARTGLGLAIGSDVQAWNSSLQGFANLTVTPDTLFFYTSGGAPALAPLTTAARALLDDANAAAMRTTLGLVIGSNVQAWDAELQAIAGLASAANKGIYFTGSGAAAMFDLSSFGRTLVDDADAAAARVTLDAPSQKQLMPAITNDRYFSSCAGQTTGAKAMTANQLSYMPFNVPNSITATRIGINVTTAVAGSARLGIYADVNGVPSGAPLLDAGTVNTGTTGEKEITISYALAPGLYWLAVAIESAISMTAENVNANSVNVPNLGFLSGSGNAVTYCLQTHTFAALPTVGTLTWTTSKLIPRVWIRNP